MTSPCEPSSRQSKQRFGGAWTLIKLDLVGQYLAAYTKALHRKFDLHYIDAFAGTGECVIRLGGERVEVPGSARLALDIRPAFDHVSLIEKSQSNVARLDELCAEYGEHVNVYTGDANTNVCRILQEYSWRRARGVLFLDPFGNEVEWATLEAIAATQAIDVWYLFPLAGLFRNAPRKASALDPSKEATLTRILGTEEWRNRLYQPPRIQDMFGGESDERHADVEQMESYARERLQSIFPYVARPRRLMFDRGAPGFSLFFMCGNPSGAAQALAGRNAGHILKS
ncbi:MAG: three-Cys-motif partner protein TcmP [Hyphomonas sp.]